MEELMPDGTSEVELIEDEAEYSRKSDFSKAEVVASQVKRCLVNRSEDMRAGYTTWIVDKDGNSKPQIIPDSRKKYCGSVEALKNLLTPEIESRDEFKALIKDFIEVKENFFEDFAYKERIKKTEEGWEYSKRIYMPQNGAAILEIDPKRPKGTNIIFTPGGWDIQINLYWEKMVELYDELFAELNRLIHKNNYFKQATGW